MTQKIKICNYFDEYIVNRLQWKNDIKKIKIDKRISYVFSNYLMCEEMPHYLIIKLTSVQRRLRELRTEYIYYVDRQKDFNKVINSWQYINRFKKSTGATDGVCGYWYDNSRQGWVFQAGFIQWMRKKVSNFYHYPELDNRPTDYPMRKEK